MAKFLRILLIIEAVVIVATCSGAAYVITSMYSKPEFLESYRAVCALCWGTSILFLVTSAVQEFLLKENPLRFRIAKIIGALLLVGVSSLLCCWIFMPNISAEGIERSAFSCLVIWLGFLPICLASAVFFKPRKALSGPESDLK